MNNKGRIEEGKDADLVIVDEDNLDIDIVFANGKKVVEKGKEEKADALMAQAEMIVAPVITTQEAPKVKGVATKTIWKFEITDVSQLPREYMTPDTTKIGSVVRATKGTLPIAGVRIYSEEVIAS